MKFCGIQFRKRNPFPPLSMRDYRDGFHSEHMGHVEYHAVFAASLPRCKMVNQKEFGSNLWEILSEIPDPEIPVINLVELGVIREN
jgi:hypothetical protein